MGDSRYPSHDGRVRDDLGSFVQADRINKCEIGQSGRRELKCLAYCGVLKYQFDWGFRGVEKSE